MSIKEKNKHWALSYGVLPSDLYQNFFKNHKISLSVSEMGAPFKTMASRIFTHFMYLLITDIIERGGYFKFPAPKRCYIEMVPITGDEFKKAYQNGAFSDIDFLASNFTGYILQFRRATRYGKWTKKIYVTSKFKDRITELTNQGHKWDMSTKRKLKDYVKIVQQQFPLFTQEDLTKIIHYGLVMYAYANRQHCDVIFYKKSGDSSMSLITGMLGKDPLTHFWRWVNKWRMKERLFYKLKGKKWDGYYYFGLTEDAHNKLINQKGKKKIIENTHLLLVKDELRHLKWVKHIWRIPWPLYHGWKFWVSKYKSDKLEYIGQNKYELYHQCFLGKFTNNEIDY